MNRKRRTEGVREAGTVREDREREREECRRDSGYI